MLERLQLARTAPNGAPAAMVAQEAVDTFQRKLSLAADSLRRLCPISNSLKNLTSLRIALVLLLRREGMSVSALLCLLAVIVGL